VPTVNADEYAMLKMMRHIRSRFRIHDDKMHEYALYKIHMRETVADTYKQQTAEEQDAAMLSFIFALNWLQESELIRPWFGGE
jgi:hypothetical protein